MRFQNGDVVGIVLHYHFFNHIANGNYAIGKIYLAEPYGKDGNILYRAKDANGNIYTGFDFNVSQSPHEFVPVDYLKEVIERNARMSVSQVYEFEERVKKLKGEEK